MIGSSKNNRENSGKIIRENAFEHKKKKPWLKVLIGLPTTGLSFSAGILKLTV